MQAAIEELKALVRERYPDATFQVTRSPDDPRTLHLLTTVDVPDTTAVADVIIDRMMELRIQKHLPIFVVPVQPRQRALEMLRAEQQASLKGRAGANSPVRAAPTER